MNNIAILYLLNVRKIELKKIHRKQFEAKDFRKLDKIEKEIKYIDEMISTIEK